MKGNLYTESEKFEREIKINKSFYKIYFCKILKFNNKSYDGFIVYKDKKIYLKKVKNYEDTLIHEIIHAFLNEISTHKKVKNKRMIKTLGGNELFIECLGYLIQQNFKLNRSKK